jgi:hypothetical protein
VGAFASRGKLYRRSSADWGHAISLSTVVLALTLGVIALSVFFALALARAAARADRSSESQLRELRERPPQVAQIPPQGYAGFAAAQTMISADQPAIR